MVYTSPSILRSENEDQVACFLEKYLEYKLIQADRINPND